MPRVLFEKTGSAVWISHLVFQFLSHARELHRLQFQEEFLVIERIFLCMFCNISFQFTNSVIVFCHRYFSKWKIRFNHFMCKHRFTLVFCNLFVYRDNLICNTFSSYSDMP